MLAGGSIPDVLQRTGESLEMEAPNPLTPELMLTAAELRSKERQQAFRGLAARSPSTSLSNLAYLLDGYSEAGGGKYAEVLLQISQRVQQILVARNRSVAKASDALLSARIIPVVLLVVFLVLTRDPLIQGSLLALPVQVVISAGIGMMVAGISSDPFNCIGGGMTLVYLIGIATAVLLIFLWVEFVPSLPKGRAAQFLRESEQLAGKKLPGWRGGFPGWISPRLAGHPAHSCVEARSDLYFAQLVGKWVDWNEVQFTSLRMALALGALLLGLVVYDNLTPQRPGSPGWLAGPRHAPGQRSPSGAPAFPVPASRVHPARGCSDGCRCLA